MENAQTSVRILFDFSLAPCYNEGMNTNICFELLTDKYNSDSRTENDLYPWEREDKGAYGFVRVRNPHYLQDGDDRKYIIRKPNPTERRDIIVNTVIECNGRTFRIPILAKRLGVSDRTVQTTLRGLEQEGIISIDIPRHKRNGEHRGNAYRYIGPPCEKYGSGLTLQILYDVAQNIGIRDWDWAAYEFARDKIWHSSYPLCKTKFEQRKARREYLESNNLPLVVPEKIKYLALRYCYWKGDKRKLSTDFLFSRDSTVKLPLFPLVRTETMTLFGHTMSVFFCGEIQNPQITISDMDTGKQLALFTWFDENIIQSERKLDARRVEQFFIIGDFTTK